MNVLKRCCYRSMRENPKRTVVTIIGIILATALITGVACLAVSFRVSQIEYEKAENGDYHYYFSGVKQENLKYFRNNAYVERMGILEEVGYAALKGSENPDKPYIYIRAIDEAGMEATALKLVEGRMPENSSEIVIGRHIIYNGMVKIRVGDVLPLEICRRMSGGHALNQNNRYTYEAESLVSFCDKTYTVVGIIERPNYMVENRMAPGYSVFTYREGDSLAGKMDVYVSFTDKGLKKAEKVISGILGVPEVLCAKYLETGTLYCTEEELDQIHAIADDVIENYWLLKWLNFSFSATTMNMIYSIAAMAVAVIIVTSVFCIRNSFMISLTEKMMFYGRLASVGTTSKQQRKIIYYEASFLGVIGIPLGIMSGILATFILVRGVSGLMEDAIDVPLVFGCSVPAVLLATGLAALTIILSASKAARIAAKMSPINAIRGNDMVKDGKRNLKCPKIVGAVFGVGGKVAYKNLKRAKIKYRTTVISIVVSVAVFIGLSTFTQLMGVATGMYYTDTRFQISVTLRCEHAYEGALAIAELEGIDAIDIVRTKTMVTDSSKVPFTDEYRADARYMGVNEIGEEEPILMVTLGESGYAAFCKEIGVSAEAARDKAIVAPFYEGNHYDEALGKIVTYKGYMAQYKQGDVIELGRPDRGDEEGAGGDKICIEVLAQTDKKPMGLSSSYFGAMVMIVSDEWMEQQGFFEEDNPEENYIISVAVRCKDAGVMEENIRRVLERDMYHYTLNNYDTSYREDRAMHLIISIFLYGFITVVALIGITNIFNTITTNMELRAPEFAMLRSVGMTGREFRRMIWLEGFFYGGKALVIGIPLGILLSFGFYMAFGTGMVTKYLIPWNGILISVFAVIVLLYAIMHFSMGKIKRRNIIDTIRNENI